MIAVPVLDPFETEVTLADESRVLSLSPRCFELPLEELLRHLAFDLVSAIPRPLGEVSEELAGPAGPYRFGSTFYQIGASVLAITTEIAEPAGAHRVIELLGVGEDVRVRINLTRLGGPPEALPPAVREAVGDGWALGQVRIWGNEARLVSDVRRTLGRQMRGAGIESRALDRAIHEPVYRPPAADRLSLDALSNKDLVVADQLLALLAALPVAGVRQRAPRQIAIHDDRIRRKGAVVSFHYETHRAGSGVLHIRRREVEAGAERPGLVRTFNVAGLRGGARVRIRDVGGRTSAEFAGTRATVAALGEWFARHMGGRG